MHRVVPLKSEGAGNAGCALHPRSRVQCGKKCAHEHTGSAEAIRHSLRNGFTAYDALSSVSRAFLPPSPRATCALRLDPGIGGSGPHAFAVRARCARLAQPARPSHPAPNVRDDREPPLQKEAGRVEDKADSDFWKSELFVRTGLNKRSLLG